MQSPDESVDDGELEDAIAQIQGALKDVPADDIMRVHLEKMLRIGKKMKKPEQNPMEDLKRIVKASKKRTQGYEKKRVTYLTCLRKLSPKLAAFMQLDPPIASIEFCTKFIGAYKIFRAYRKDAIPGESARLVELFSDHPDMLRAKHNIGFGMELERIGLITKEIVREQPDGRYIQIEALLKDGIEATGQIKEIVNRAINSDDPEDYGPALEEQEKISAPLIQRWLELGLPAFD